MTRTTTPQPVTARQLWFTGTRQVEIREQLLPAPDSGEVLVETLCSAISAGTELLVYREQIPQDMLLDASLAGMQQAPAYPLQYGYACVGRVIQAGAGLAATWMGRLVFAFQPHASHFAAKPTDLVLLPDGIDPEDAVFFANLETAVNLVQDGKPAVGERVVVLGQGSVGLLLSALLAQHPLAGLYALDTLPARRQRALQLGVHKAFDPASEADIAALKQLLSPAAGACGADLLFEVSGVPSALNQAIALSGYASRIVIGSWYGSKSAAIGLGGEAHRNRLQISTSQVSTVAPELGGRWDKARRLALTWELLRQLKPRQLITHRRALTDAAALYQQLDQAPGDLMQAVFIYQSPQQ